MSEKRTSTSHASTMMRSGSISSPGTSLNLATRLVSTASGTMVITMWGMMVKETRWALAGRLMFRSVASEIACGTSLLKTSVTMDVSAFEVLRMQRG